jgi:hypothetical protein
VRKKVLALASIVLTLAFAGEVGASGTAEDPDQVNSVYTASLAVADLLGGVSEALAAVEWSATAVYVLDVPVLDSFDWRAAGDLAVLGHAYVDPEERWNALEANVEATFDRVGDLVWGLVGQAKVYLAVARSSDMPDEPVVRWLVASPPGQPTLTGSWTLRWVTPDGKRTDDARSLADALVEDLPDGANFDVVSDYLPGIGALISLDYYGAWHLPYECDSLGEWEAVILNALRSEADAVSDLPEEEDIVVASPFDQYVGASGLFGGSLYFIVPVATATDSATWRILLGQ